jgi:hypothetical protein
MPVAGYILLYVLLFRPVLFSTNLLAPGDAWLQSVPAFHCPPTLWSQMLFGGFPVFADPQVQTWYPLQYLFKFMPGGWNCYVLAAFALSASFAHGCVYSITRSTTGAIVGGITYGMSGFLISNLCHTPMIHAAMFAPLLIWSITELKKSSRPIWFTILCAAVACGLLAGHPQTSVYSLYLSAAYACLCAFELTSRRAQFLSTCSTAFIFGCGIASIQLLPSLELSLFGERTKLPYHVFVSFSLPPISTVSLVFPHLFGGPAGSPFGSYFGPLNLQTTSGYFGFVPFMLAVLALASQRQARVWFWAVVTVIALALTFGDACPLSRLAYLVPGYGHFRCPTRHFLEVSLAISILAGFGVVAIQRHQATLAQVMTALGAGFLAAMTALVALFCNAHFLQAQASQHVGGKFDPILWNNPAIDLALIILLLSACSFLLAWRFANSKTTMALLITILILDLGSFAAFSAWRYDHPDSTQLQLPASLRDLRNEVIDSSQRMLSVRGIAGSTEELPPNTSRLWGVPSAGGYTPLVFLRHIRLMSIAAGGWLFKPLGSNSIWPDLMSVRFVIAPNQASSFDFIIDHLKSDHRHFNLAHRIGDALVFENMRAMPRAWLVHKVQSLGTTEVLHILQSGIASDGSFFDPHKQALVEEPCPFQQNTPGNEASDRIEIVRTNDNEQQLITNSTSTAFLVRSDIDYPGWHATIDGKPAAIYQTDYLLQGVVVPPGRRLVSFSFRPTSLLLGTILSVCSIIALGLFCIILSRRSTTRFGSVGLIQGF